MDQAHLVLLGKNIKRIRKHRSATPCARPSGSCLRRREGAQNIWTSKWLDRLRVKPENTEMLISPSSSWTNTWPTSWSFWSFGTAHTHLWHFGSFRPCVAGDNQRTSNLFLMLSPETMELERVSGVNAENPMHGHQIKSANSIGFVIYVDLCSLIGRTCEDDLAPCTDFRFVQHSQHKHPLVRTNIIIARHLKTAFIPTSARSFTMLPSGKLTWLWKITFVLWKNSLFLWAMFNSYVKLPEGISVEVDILGPLAAAVLEAHRSQEASVQQVHHIHGCVAWALLTPELTPFNT